MSDADIYIKMDEDIRRQHARATFNVELKSRELVILKKFKHVTQYDDALEEALSGLFRDFIYYFLDTACTPSEEMIREALTDIFNKSTIKISVENLSELTETFIYLTNHMIMLAKEWDID